MDIRTRRRIKVLFGLFVLYSVALPIAEELKRPSHPQESSLGLTLWSLMAVVTVVLWQSLLIYEAGKTSETGPFSFATLVKRKWPIMVVFGGCALVVAWQRL